MKLAFLTLYLLVCSVSYAQKEPKKVYTLADMPFEVDSTTGGIVYRGVVQVEGATQNQLYSRAKAFLLKAFTNNAQVIQTDDQQGGVLGAKGQYALPMSAMGLAVNNLNQIYYEMPIEIRVKDGRYRYEVSNLELVSGGLRYNMDRLYKKNPHLYDKMSERQYRKYTEKDPIGDLVKQLKSAMSINKSKEDF